MNCLCCSKPIPEDAEAYERECEWHRRCIKRFFGTTRLPDINLSEEQLLQLAKDSVNLGLTVPGVQKKLSLHLTAGENPRMTLVGYPAGFILKPPSKEYPFMPEAEQLAMQIAEFVGISVVPHALIRIPGQENKAAYITRRIDRLGKRPVKLLAMEDFCQLAGRLAQDKYSGSYERCAKIILRWSCRAGIDLTDFFNRLLFCFVIGNADMHLKNFSLIETAPQNRSYILSPAYDLLPTSLLLPEDPDELALTLNGKKRNLRRKDFLCFANTAGIHPKAANAIIERIISFREAFLSACEHSQLSEEMKKIFADTLCTRLDVLTKHHEGFH